MNTPIRVQHHTYLEASKTAGYSGFVIYQPYLLGAGEWQKATFWMVPGTYQDDWDNQ